MTQETRFMHTSRGRALFGIGLLLMGALTLAGCDSGEGTTLTATQERDQLLKVVDETAAQLPGHIWNPVGASPVAAPCGSDGNAQTSHTVASQPGTDQLADAKTIRDYWRSLGMEVRLVETPIPVVYATGGPVQRMSFGTGPALYDISGTSLCAVGDAAELNKAAG